MGQNYALQKGQKKSNLAVKGIMSKKSVPVSVCFSTHNSGNGNVWCGMQPRRFMSDVFYREILY